MLTGSTPSQRLGQFIDALQQKTSRLVVKTTGTTKTLELVPLTQKLDQSYNAAPDAIYQAFKTLIKGHANECDKNQLETLKAIIHKKLTVVKASQSGLINWLFLLFNTLLKTQLRNEKQSLMQLEQTLLETLSQSRKTSRKPPSKKSASTAELDLLDETLKPRSTSGSIPQPKAGAGSNPGSIPPPPPGPPPPPRSANPISLTNSVISVRRNPPLPEPPSPLLNEPAQPPFLPTNRIPTEDELNNAKHYLTDMRANLMDLKMHAATLKNLKEERTKIEQTIREMELGIERCKVNISRLKAKTDKDFVFLEFSSKSGPFQAPVWTKRAYRENFPNRQAELSGDDDDDDWDHHEDGNNSTSATDSLTGDSKRQLTMTLLSQLSQSQANLNTMDDSSSSSKNAATSHKQSESSLTKRSAIFNVPFMLLVQKSRLKHCLTEHERLIPILEEAKSNHLAKSTELANLRITDIEEAISARESYIDICEKIIKKRETAMKAAAERRRREEQNRLLSENETQASSSQQGEPVTLSIEALREKKFLSYFNKLTHNQLGEITIGLRVMSKKTPDEIAEELNLTFLGKAVVVEEAQVGHPTPQKQNMKSRALALQAVMQKTAVTETGTADVT